MQQDELLRHIVKILERLKLRYFVTGSIAAMYFGEPRFKKNINIEGWADTMGLETLWRTLKMRALDAQRAADES